MAKKEAVEKKEKKKKSFMSRLLKFLLIFIIFLIVLLVAVCLIPYFLWKVNVINVVKDLRVLNQKVDESKIVTNAYSESDLESAKKIFDVKIIDSKEYSISDKEICAYINDQIENDKVDLSAFNEFGDKIEIRQIEFTIPSEGIDYLAEINTVLQIDLSDVKASWDFPKSLMTNFIPSKIYISTTAKVEKDTTSESGYEYKVSTLDFCVNNLNNNQTSEFLEAVDLVTNVDTAEEYGNQISKIVVDSLIGNTENKGLFYTLKNLSSYYEAKSYSFKQVDGKNCFAILTNVDYDYVINYNGLTEEQEQTLNHGASNKEDWTLSTNVKKVGYTCSWYEDEAFTKEITVIAKDESRTGVVQVYAKFTPNKYTVIFNDPDSTQTMSKLEMTYDVGQYLPKNTFTKSEAYTFAYWTYENDEGKTCELADGAWAINLTAENERKVTLTAKWVAREYTITYNTNGGTISGDYKTTYMIVSEVDLPTPTKTGYDFKGWNDGKTEITKIVKGRYGNIALMAVWEATQYTITYDTNGKTVDTSNYIASYTIETNFTLPTAKCAGYDFDGWKIIEISGDTNFDTSVIYNNENLTGKYGSVKFQAQWTPRIYTITYDTNGKMADIPNYMASSYTIETNFTLPTAECVGYDFGGGKIIEISGDTNFDESVTYKNENLTGKYGSVKFQAQWTPHSYTITYDTNGKLVDTSNYIASYTIETNFTLPTAKCAGYDFDGWKIIEISGDTNFDESVIYNNENLTGKYGSVKFQAQWTPRIYTITLAEVDTATSYTYTITSQTLSIENPTRSSKGFETWLIAWSDSDHSDDLPTFDITTDTTTLNLQANTYGNITLTASWCNTCNVNLVVDGATFLLSQVKVDSVYTLPTGDLSGNGYGGYTIEGWYEDENLTTSCSSSQTITKNINFYAKSKYIVGYTNEIQSFYDYEDTVDVDEILKNKLVTVKNDTELRAWIAYVMFYHVTEEVCIKFDYEYKTEEITTPEGKIRQIFDEDGTLITKYKIGSNEAGNGVFCYASTDDNYSVYNSSSDKIYQQQNYAYAMTGTTTTRDFKVDKIGKTCNVSTSLQLVYALEYGYRPICETGSNAEIVYNKAKAVLAEICTDDMDNVTKMRAIYEWLALNVNYDYDVAEATGIDARNWDSWAVEGVFNSKKAVCEGYAKALLVMARIEGIPALYVTGNGHAWNRVYINGAWYGIDATHADVGVADKGLEVFTYKEFLFTDAYKTSRGYTSTNFANYEAKTTYNTYTNIGNGTTFDLQIDGDVNGVQKYTNALDEFKAFYNTVSSTIASTKTTYATIEVSVTNPEINAGDLLGAITNFSSSYSANTISVVADVNGNNVITLLISKKSA